MGSMSTLIILTILVCNPL